MYMPHILSGYLQLALNVSIVLFLLYAAVQLIVAVQSDVEIKVEEYSSEILREIELCSKNYLENRCNPPDRIPAMEKTCEMWETCMRRDPTVIGRTRVSAETIAGILNSFVEPISYKTMLFFLLLLFGFTLVSNMAFYMARMRYGSKPEPEGLRNPFTVHPSTAHPHTQMIPRDPHRYHEH